MPTPPLKQFCFCANLPVGGVIIGALQTGYYTITLICAAVLLGIIQEVHEAVIEQAKEDGEDHQQFEAFGQISAGILWPIIIFRAIGIGTSICLIVGTQKRNNHFLLPYLIFEGIAIGALVLLWFFAVPGRRSTGEGFAFFFFLTLYIALNKYFWLCVLSLYFWISNEQRSELGNANGQVMIPLQTIPENQRVYMPANNVYPLQQQPLYIPQPTNAYPQQQMYLGQQPPAYPVQAYNPLEKV